MKIEFKIDDKVIELGNCSMSILKGINTTPVNGMIKSKPNGIKVYLIVDAPDSGLQDYLNNHIKSVITNKIDNII